MLLETSTSSVDAQVRVFLELLDVIAVLLGPDFPVHMPQVVAAPCTRGAARNSTDCPKYGLRCIPDRKPSTMCRARRSSREMRAIASGCKNLLESGITRKLVFFGGSNLDQAIDDVVGGYAFAFGGEIEDQADAAAPAWPGLECRRSRHGCGRAAGRGPWRPGSGTARPADRRPNSPDRAMKSGMPGFADPRLPHQR